MGQGVYILPLYVPFKRVTYSDKRISTLAFESAKGSKTQPKQPTEAAVLPDEVAVSTDLRKSAPIAIWFGCPKRMASPSSNNVLSTIHPQNALRIRGCTYLAICPMMRVLHRPREGKQWSPRTLFLNIKVEAAASAVVFDPHSAREGYRFSRRPHMHVLFGSANCQAANMSIARGRIWAEMKGQQQPTRIGFGTITNSEM